MRKPVVLFFGFLVSAGAAVAAEKPLGPAGYLAILMESKLHYNMQLEPAKVPAKQMTCGRRPYMLRVVSKDGGKSLVPWNVKPEASKLLDEAEALYGEKKFDEAGVKYQAATAVDPEAVSGYLYYGDTLLLGERKDAAAALEQYRKAIALDPTLPIGHFFASTALNVLGRPDEAREEVIKALIYDPTYAAIWKILDSERGQWNTKPVIRHPFEPPTGFLGAADKDGIVVYGGKNGEWLGYALCKAAWANEDRFKKQRGGTDGWSLEEERACAGNQLFGSYNVAEGAVEAEQKKKGVRKPAATEAETIAAMTPLGRHLLEVAKAGMLDGYILFEIIGQRCPMAMSMSDDESFRQLDGYIRHYVIIAKE